MKKKLPVLAALLLAAVLSGCACKHEFTEADCLNPQVCTKCEEQGAAALGHDFAPATCDVPETCTRCGEIQGEKLAHVYGSWQFEGEEMFKACENCGTEERTLIDRELYLKEALLGFWDFYGGIEDGQIYMNYELQYRLIGDYLNLKDDGTAVYYAMSTKKVIPLTWEYDSFDNSEGIDTYRIIVNSEETGSFAFYIEDNEGTDMDRAYYFYGENNILFMTRHTPFDNSLASSWVCIEDEDTYTLTLNPDHSFTMDLDPEISGTWHITALFASGSSAENASAYIKLKLHYPSGDGYEVIESSIYLGGTDQSMEELAAYLDESHINLYVEALETSLSFEKMSAEELETYYKAAEEGKAKVVGDWTSKLIETSNYETDEEGSVINTDYSVTFAEDGTFTAKLEEELTGTWSLDDVDVFGDYENYYYRISIDGQDSSWSANADSGGNNVYLYYYDGDVQTTIKLGRLSEEDKAKLAEAPQQLIGVWNCTTQSWYDEIKMEYVSEEATGSMTFREDGTFTLILDKEYTGTWYFSDYSADRGFEYSAKFDHEENQSYRWTMYTPGQISIFFLQDDTYYTYQMTKN